MRVRTMADVGAVVRDARERAGLTQAELARRSGVSREWLVAVEAGRTPAALPRVLDVFEELGLTLNVSAEGGWRG
ncbi:helix-turn-helix domain-containing protein [Pseudactinotalea terrae]|uniref:helix-turn-helix domain-containing protein n=1 Tax=Pseudactinotalea terrae TaxID=1743262 RepID=UPI0012E2D294|nr:helix-turn-helix domain-containing protein [Pseudactinotalea terrae]